MFELAGLPRGTEAPSDGEVLMTSREKNAHDITRTALDLCASTIEASGENDEAEICALLVLSEPMNAARLGSWHAAQLVEYSE